LQYKTKKGLQLRLEALFGCGQFEILSWAGFWVTDSPPGTGFYRLLDDPQGYV